MKTCRKCQTNKPLDDFFRTSLNKDGRRSYCKPCDSKMKQESIARNLEAHKLAKKKEKLKSRYGITLDQQKEMAKQQNYKCAISGCGTELKLDKFTHVDHQESPFKVRGLLCKSCNNALGLINDNFDTALGLAKYIQEHKGVI